MKLAFIAFALVATLVAASPAPSSAPAVQQVQQQAANPLQQQAAQFTAFINAFYAGACTAHKGLDSWDLFHKSPPAPTPAIIYCKDGTLWLVTGLTVKPMTAK